MGRSWQNIDFILCEHNLNSHDRTVWHYKEKIDRALRVIFRIIRVLLSILRDSVAYTLTHLVIMPESYTCAEYVFIILMFKNFFFLKIEEWNRGHPFFFFMYYCPKEAKNTNALREVIMKNKQKRISDEF